ncbi:MAG: ferredoxin--NADP(+) reductase [Gammaproteobacteria bacterium]|nr:ferredoxin--NADP(+) reductase [Gammaproteobacteria bacterium]
MSKWIEAKVTRLQQWTHELYSVQVDAKIPPFTAGQFTRLALEIDGEMVARPYSFVNGPDNPVHEFYFITVKDGPLTAELVRLKPGDSLYIAPKSAGFFVLEEVPDADTLWMLSTGTAIGPYLSILSTAAPWERFRNIVLVHAVRHAKELTYPDTIAALLAGHTQQLQFIPFVSREETGFAIPGRVPDAIEDGRLEQRAALELSAANSQVMICGNPAMVRDTRKVLEARGLKINKRREPGQITTEQYWKD